MSHMELNLWDAKRIHIQKNRLVIDTLASRIFIVLPEDFDLPELVEEVAKATVIQLELEEPEDQGICNHHPAMHRIRGGCTYSNCTCTLSRFDDHEEIK